MKQKPNDQQPAFQFADSATKRRGTPRTGQDRACEICGTMFYVQPWMIRNEKGRFCSRKCCGISLRGKPSIKRNGQDRVCGICGKMFWVQRAELKKKGHGQFCSRSCSAIAQRGKPGPKPRNGQDYACETCGTMFYVQPSRRQRGYGRFCSLACADASKRGKPGPRPRTRQEYPCEQCGKPMYVGPYSRKNGHGRFCSRPCFAQARKTGKFLTKGKGVGKFLKCLKCGTEMWAVSSVVERKKYCSRSCSAKARNNLGIRPIAEKRRACGFCKQEFIAKSSRRKYCSQQCVNAARCSRFVRQCKTCNGDMDVKPSESKTRRYCSKKCANVGKRGHRIVGPGRRAKRYDGYITIYYPTHPSSNKQGIIFEHRLVAEEKYGRRLQFGEHVHHINGIKDDNRPENLEIIWIDDHARITNQEAKVKRRKERVELATYRRKFGPLEES